MKVYDFDEVYKSNVQVVYKFLLKLTGNPDVSEEITQQTFYKAFIAIDEFKGTCKLNVWLCQIAKNEYYNYLKKESKKHNFDKEPTSDDILLEDVIKNADVLLIHKVLHNIQEPYKEVFTLRTFAGLSYREIGTLFDKSENWARVVYFRAKDKIIEALREEYDYEV